MTAVAERTMFAEWLGEQLHARRLNRAQLAAYMQRPQSTVASWFNDGRIPRPEVCLDIARVLHIEADEVLRRAGHLPPAAEPSTGPRVIPEALRLLGEMTEAEQRAFAIPALELAEALLARARAGLDPPEQFPPPPSRRVRRRGESPPGSASG